MKLNQLLRVRDLWFTLPSQRSLLVSWLFSAIPILLLKFSIFYYTSILSLYRNTSLVCFVACCRLASLDEWLNITDLVSVSSDILGDDVIVFRMCPLVMWLPLLLKMNQLPVQVSGCHGDE